MDPKSTVSGPPSAHHRNTIQMAFCWHADDGLTLNAGSVASCFVRGPGPELLRNPIIFRFFRGSGPPVLPMYPHMGSMLLLYRLPKNRNK